MQGGLNVTFGHMGKFGQILRYMCKVVLIVHEQHDAACSGQRVQWLRSGHYQFEMGMVRARSAQLNLKIGSFACKGA